MIPLIFWQVLSMFADIQYWIGLTVGALIIYYILPKSYKHKILWIVLVLLPAVIISYQFTYVLKIWFQVPRPCLELNQCPPGFSLPSGHASVIFAFATVASLNAKKKKLYLFTFPLAVLVGLSRFFLGYHTLLDVAAGAIIGMFFGYLIFTAYKTISVLLETK